MSGAVEVLPVDREAAANVVATYRDQKNGNWQQRIRDGLCDDGEMVQAFARHRLTTPPARSYADGVEDAAKVALKDMTPGYGPHRSDMEALADIQRSNIAAAIRLLSQGGKA